MLDDVEARVRRLLAGEQREQRAALMDPQFAPLAPVDAALAQSFGRRAFLSRLGGGLVAAGLAPSALITACGGRHLDAPVAQVGSVRGTVTDLQGAPQSVGRIYLLLDSGLNENIYADVNATGAFDFGQVDVGNYQLRYWGGNEAEVPESLANPVRITVKVGTPTVVQFQIVPGTPNAQEQEIYAGDYFYQQQPFGEPNALVTVKLGTTVCWYNVGQYDHTVTGGPWGDSGTLGRAANFMWTTDRVGTFPYRCNFHNPQMQAVLQVVA